MVNTHIYWNPQCEDVKLAQAIYLAETMERWRGESCNAGAGTHEAPPEVILCGDLNSRPPTPKPINPTSDALGGRPRAVRDGAHDSAVDGGVAATTRRSGVMEFLLTGSVLPSAVNRTRLLCDSELNRLCRWLRILGLDCALEKPAEKQARTARNDCGPLFERAVQEDRFLLTSSKRVMQRSTCPSALLLDPRQMEPSLLRLWDVLAPPLRPERFLTRCVKCNGDVKGKEHWPDAEKIMARVQGDEAIPKDLELFMCICCEQVGH